ncbi:O-antigen ligase domain-containing protein [Qaidamihabitans albus]|uniref:O-antigen ligase domain-containing protein n=1 Tax=Qaidamihabitans albus TaxID=2795733 RepID=UPI001F332F84|nr:O-antigen ligase domain-containing protein [Qaidamihabitans albus]
MARDVRTGPAAPAEQRAPVRGTTPRLVGLIWALLILNTLGSTGAVTVVPIPRLVTQVLTMGALVAAFGLALLLNPRLRVRPSAYLLLLTLLLVVSVIASADLESGFGALFRCARFAVFIATLWLLTRWWDGSLTLVRQHIRVLGVVLVSVVLGMVISPGLAFPESYGGRLVGALWPLTAPQVGQYAAVVAGLTLVLWLSRRTDGRSALLVAGPATAMLVLSHTRTATVGLLAALAIAGLSLLFTSVRARKAFGWTVAGTGLLAVVAAPAVQAWFQRGQTDENFSNLTGRAKVWDALLDQPRTVSEEVFGVGLTDKSFDGLPIDSSWLAVYHEQGYLGIVIVAAFLGTLLVASVLRPPSPARACAIFLVTYCLVTSYTEAGLGDASPYLLYLALAAALLARPQAPPDVPGTAGRVAT